MIVSVGIDLVSVESVEDSLRQFGDRYLTRVFTPQEVEDCSDGGRPSAERLAARFAAKEAAIKALRLPPGASLGWHSIELVRSPEGWTELRLTGEALRLADSRGLSTLAVSVTHEGGMAAAVVTACGEPG